MILLLVIDQLGAHKNEPFLKSNTPPSEQVVYGGHCRHGPGWRCGPDTANVSP